MLPGQAGSQDPQRVTIVGLGPRGERAAAADELELTASEAATARAAHFRVGVVLHTADSDWSKQQFRGIIDTLDPCGAEVIGVVDSSFQVEKEIAGIEEMIAHHPDAIISIPVDDTATAAAYRKIGRAGIKLVLMDNAPKGLESGTDYVSVVSADNFGLGQIAAEELAPHVPTEGTVGIIGFGADFFATREREIGFKMWMKDNRPDVTIKESSFSTLDEAGSVAVDLLIAVPGLAGLFVVWDQPAMAVVRSLTAVGRDIPITTVDLGGEVALEMAKGGMIKGVGAQHPYEQGVAEARAAVRALLGKHAPSWVALPAMPVTATDLLATYDRPLPVPAVPPLRRSSLPAQPTRLFGRNEELMTIEQRLVAGTVRLLTLVGPAGVGKTRLAMEAAARVGRHFPAGVKFVDLAPMHCSEHVLPAIAQMLAVQVRSDRPLVQGIADTVQDRPMLLILDNFEHLLPAAPQLADLLANSSGMTLLVTSREPLRLRWEQTLRIPPLPVPDIKLMPPLAVLSQIPSVALFLDRAQAVSSAFVLTEGNAQAVAELCAHLEGLPLAIELASGRTCALSPQMLLARLRRRLSLLSWEAQDLPKRQRSLGAAIGWSYDLLPHKEQAFFRQLSVFVGGFDLEGAEALVAAMRGPAIEAVERLNSLVDKSLVQATGQQEGHVRYFMLESIRRYAWEQLEARGELQVARCAHATYLLGLAERASLQAWMSGDWSCFSRLEREHDNCRAALRWLLDCDDPKMGLRLATALAPFWGARGYQAEGSLWLDEALTKLSHAEDVLCIRALLEAGQLLLCKGESQRARTLFEQALVLAEQGQDSSNAVRALTHLGLCALQSGDLSESAQLLQTALVLGQELGDQLYAGLALGFLALISDKEGHHEHAASLYSRALHQWEVGGWESGAAAFSFHLAVVMKELGDLPRAIKHIQAGARVALKFPDRWLLSIGLQALLLMIGCQTSSEQLARLVEARDTLRQAADRAPPVLERLFRQPDPRLCERPEQHTPGAAYRGGQSLSYEEIAALMQAVLDEFAQGPAPRTEARKQDPDQMSALSERELEVLRLVAQGCSNKGIGQRLFISTSTVNHHLTSIFQKLDVDARAQAVAVAARRGIL